MAIIHCMRKSVRVMLYVVCVVVVLLMLGILVLANYMFKFALDPSSEKDVFTVESADGSEDFYEVALAPDEAWLFSSSQDEYITSHDGLKLHSYFVSRAEPSDKYVILVHGYKSAAGAMASFARHYYDNGWNVLVPDQRSHGKSEGRYIGMGWPEHYDMIAWAELLAKKNSNAQIVLHGVSMGAATVMLVSGEKNLPGNICAVVEDCGYTSIGNQLAFQLKATFKLPVFPLLQVSSLVTKIRAGYFFGDGDCVEAVSNSVTPTLFIHGDEDSFVPFAMLDELYNAAVAQKQKLVVAGAEHANAMDVNPQLYWATVDAFLEKYAQGPNSD